MPTAIRSAVANDAKPIATLHATVWRETYQNLAPPEILAKLDLAHRLNTWEMHLNTPSPQHHILLASWGETIVGFTFFGPATNPVFGTHPEVKHLYVDSKCQGAGIGKQLLHAAFQQLLADGFSTAALATAKGNTPALAFYQAMGGKQVGQFIDAGPIWKSENLIIAWDNLQTSPL